MQGLGRAVSGIGGPGVQAAELQGRPQHMVNEGQDSWLQHALHEDRSLVHQVGQPARPGLLLELGPCRVALFGEERFDAVHQPPASVR
jgi:hypothetical protein